ncbi:MAG TPA: cupin domain-containing protein [Pseudonocardiaceae bacterium]|jgi:uncharacterized RmlC-like cupin family protein|nr:cupin domain-containing protein [Pseudonocardiaceae bacterium]
MDDAGHDPDPVPDQDSGQGSEHDAWHRRLHHVRSRNLSDATAQTPGMRRRAAISRGATGAEAIWMGENTVHGGVASDNHHHGESETGIYVLSGHPVFVFAEGDTERRIETEPGDYVFVPPFVPHREENPGDEDAVVILARSTQEAIVVNLPTLFGD